ncbi:MAG: hypothetical protein ABJL99_14245 [Aliishimia sp.]
MRFGSASRFYAQRRAYRFLQKILRRVHLSMHLLETPVLLDHILLKNLTQFEQQIQPSIIHIRDHRVHLHYHALPCIGCIHILNIEKLPHGQTQYDGNDRQSREIGRSFAKLLVNMEKPMQMLKRAMRKLVILLMGIPTAVKLLRCQLANIPVTPTENFIDRGLWVVCADRSPLFCSSLVCRVQWL